MIETSPIIKRAIKAFGTPLHLYFPKRVSESAEQFKRVAKEYYPNTEILFAVKSNPCIGAIRLIGDLGLGVDVASEFELKAAKIVGIEGDQIVCNGNAKTDDYIESAIRHGATISADCLEEVKLIGKIAGRIRKQANVMIRLSGMALDGLTSADQSTAAHWTKFGIPFRDWRKFFDLAGRDPFIDPVGISAHIGTQICDARGYEKLTSALLGILEAASAEGWRMKRVDFGGGFPLSYLEEDQWVTFQGKLKDQRNGAPTSEWVTWGEVGMGGFGEAWSGKAYWSLFPGARMFEHILTFRPNGGKTVAERLKSAGNPLLCIEPGRGLFGEAGMTIAKVMGVKEVEGNNLVITDLGIVNHGTVLVTPDIYPMFIYPPKSDDKHAEVFVAGRLCFTGDMISKVKIPLNRLPKRGETLVIGMTGAYCADHFASNSCGFPRPPKVAVLEDGSFEVWRKAERFEEVFDCKL